MSVVDPKPKFGILRLNVAETGRWFPYDMQEEACEKIEFIAGTAETCEYRLPLCSVGPTSQR